MNKLKIYLVLFVLPVSFLIYHITSFEVGINGYIEKKKQLKKLYYEKSILQKNITKLENKIILLNSNKPDRDLLEEKSFELLGNAEKNTYHVILDSL